MDETPETIRYTADIVVLAGQDQVLLIERGWDPFEGHWALPGGHVDVGETSLDAAVRELREETGVHVLRSRLHQIGAWDAPGRDPRGRYVTVAYATHFVWPVDLNAGDDARQAAWWPTRDLPTMAFDHADIVAEALRQGR